MPRMDDFPIPPGFTVYPTTPEAEIRAAYEQLKIHEKVHFVAVRGPTHAVLNVIGPDAVMHTVRRFWAETPGAEILIQRMIHSMWCGKAQWHGKELTITANEGMLLLDPDTYVDGTVSLAPKQRKMIRHVDGSAKLITLEGYRQPMPSEIVAKITELATKVGTEIGWAVDDLDKVWLLGMGAAPYRGN